MKPLIVGTRGSALALAQTRAVMADLQSQHPALELDLRIIKTSGDAWAQQSDPTPAPGKGLFTGELEEALRRGEVDLAVHSLKDLPVDNAPGLILGAIPARADWRDVLITRAGEDWSALPSSACLATGSPRRLRQVLHARPDLRTANVRGNIDTRLRKLRETPEWTGLILAAAGLNRLQPDLTGLTLSRLEADIMLPAPGQGALALQIRATDDATHAIVSRVHDGATSACVAAERSFLQGLGGGCSYPAAALGQIGPDGQLFLRAIAWWPEEDGWCHAGGEGECRLDEAAELGAALAQRMREGA